MKKHYPPFYQAHKNQLMSATILLSLTSWIRAILDLIRYFDSSGLDFAIEESVRLNTWLAPVYDSMMYLLSDFLPILA